MSTLKHWRARASRTRLRAPLVHLRHLGLDLSDVFLASYPRSGNTMLRFILAEALAGEPSSFDNIQRTIPEIGVHANARALLPCNGRLIKTHEPYRSSYRRAIYIVRDVRDVMLSCFARESAMDVLHIRSLDDYVLPFMQGRMTRFGSWQDHVESWLNSPLAQRGDLLLLNFEDVKKDLEGTVLRCLQFLGVNIDPVLILDAVRNNSLQKMRGKEDMARLLPKSPRELGRWIGRGSVQGWRTELTIDQLKVINELAGKHLARFGYPTGIASEKQEQQSSSGFVSGDAFRHPVPEPKRTRL
jgi:hypothetical protein